ncbi:MAG: TRZ/ATZ family hydrolase [Candidatus Accumulibacter sp.]|jgi:5-methylthioadenosine/S-adenosylhomocysteine deaminase|nr:TRZ/ATZ family hydrolase [Accumulibacter sp.]
MPDPVDLLIEAKWIIPVEPANVVLENHSIAVDKGRIVAVLQQSEGKFRFAPREIAQRHDHVLIPGLINLHTHAAMVLLRGLADDLPLDVWLRDHIWPAEAKFVSPQFVHDGSLLACAEMLRGGITCFNDMYFFPQATVKAAQTLGIRAVIGLITMDFPTAYAADADDYLAKGMAVRDEFRDDPLLNFCLAPHAPYTVSDRNFEKVLTLAEQCDIPVHLHIHETRKEIEDSLKLFGMRPIERLRRLGVLGPGLIGAHAVHLEDHEMRLLAQHGCSVAHCPGSNLKLASGIAPIVPMLQKGVNIGLGTDGAASNNRLDILQELRLALLLAKGSSGRADAIGAHRALRLATLGGARALGLDGEIGSVEVGKSADLCAIEIDDSLLSPCYDPASLLAYSAGREQVSDVWVAGKARVSNGTLLCCGMIELKNLAALWQNRIRS